MEESCPVSPPRARDTSAPGRGVLTPQQKNSPTARPSHEENDAQPPPDKSSGKRRREPGVGDKSDSGGGGDPMDWTPTKVPTEIKKGLAFFPGAVSVQTFSEGEREHIEPRLTFQRAYDSVDILSNGRPVEGGIDLDKAPVLAGVIDEMTGLVGVRPDCVHATTREGGQIHTSHSDKMKFDVRGTVHLGADVLLGGQVDSTKSTGDFVLSSGGLLQPLQLRMRSGDAYIATAKVLHAPFLHGISPPDQASLSIVSTWSPGRGAFNLFRSKSRPLIETFSSLCGVKAVDGEEAFQVTTTDRVPPKKVKARIRQSGDFTDGVSLFQAPPAEQASAYHRLGKMRSPNGGRTGGTIGGMNSGGGGNQTGNAGWSGAGHAARDFSAGGAGEKYFALHLKVPADKLSATLQRLVQEDGSLEPLPPLCDIDVSPGYPGVTKAKGLFGLDEGRVVPRVHNSHKPNLCVSGGAIPVTTRTPPFKVPAFAVGPLRAGMVILRNRSNANALQKNKKN